MAIHLSYDVLSRLVERRAAPVEEARAQRHLLGCGRCRSELAWLERIRSLPQRTDDFERASLIAEGPGDGWGNVGPGRASPADRSGGELDERPSRRGVAAYWLRNPSSAVLG
jgi:hypothetical protein